MSLRLGAAGMPPALHHRAASRAVDELAAGAPPLGTGLPASYEEISATLEPGDALLLFTDGLPELANPEGDLLGYEAVRRLFADLAAGTPDEILEGLHVAALRHASDRPRDDDLTLVVLKVRSLGEGRFRSG